MDKKPPQSFGDLQVVERPKGIKLQDASILHAAPEQAQKALDPNITQQELKRLLPAQNARSIFELKLPSGPYTACYDSIGAHMLLAGSRGHFGLVRMRDMHMLAESHLDDDRVFAACFLHNVSLFAAARRREITIFDDHCVEIHNIRRERPMFLDFLPHHWLLTSVSADGALSYLDISTGEDVARLFTRSGTPSCLASNPRTAISSVSFASHSFVNLYTPNQLTGPVMSIDCNRGGVARHLYSRDGNHLITVGRNGFLKVFDMRCTASELFCTRLRYAGVNDVHLSQKGILGLCYDRVVDFYDYGKMLEYSYDNLPDVPESAVLGIEEQAGAEGYISVDKIDALRMRHALPGGRAVSMTSLCHRPFYDDWAVGLSTGVQSIVVPGSGSPDFDSFTANIYETGKQRSERTVRSLLEKIPHTLIGHGDALSSVHRATAAERVQFRYGLLNERIGNRVTRDKKGRSVAAKKLERASRLQVAREMEERVRREDAAARTARPYLRPERPERPAHGQPRDGAQPSLARFKRRR